MDSVQAKLRVLFIHPYGADLGDWNYRIKKQIELMSQKCELKVVNLYVSQETGISESIKKYIRNEIDGFKPDVLYVCGYLIVYECLKYFKKIVFDMGAYKTRNILMDICKLDYSDLNSMKGDDLKHKVMSSYNSIYFEREDYVIKNVPAIIIWEGDEAKLVRKIHKVDNVNEISMVFYDLPQAIPFEEKKDRVLAVAAKWGDVAKNGKLVNKVNLNMKNAKFDDKYIVKTVGHSGENNIRKFVPHEELMNMINESKVIFCPYLCGGIGIVNEALRLGCNVIIGEWFPYRKYVSDELIIHTGRDRVGNSVNVIKKAMDKYYEPTEKLPDEEIQISRILEVCNKVSNNNNL
jgi:hypothetical protein